MTRVRAFLKRWWPALVLLAAYAATVVAANWLTATWGAVAAAPALLVPAGTYTAGLALGLRDGLQDAAGVRWVLTGIGAGTAASFLVSSPALAFGSGAAFLLAELLDLAVYTPLKNASRRVTAVVVSNTAGAAVDTTVFLLLAAAVLGPWEWPLFWGQMVVKAGYCTVAYLAVRYGVPKVWRKFRYRRSVAAVTA